MSSIPSTQLNFTSRVEQYPAIVMEAVRSGLIGNSDHAAQLLSPYCTDEDQIALIKTACREGYATCSSTFDLLYRIDDILKRRAPSLLPIAGLTSSVLAPRVQILFPLPIGSTHLCFSEVFTSTNIFCSEEPFEFGGKYYTNALSCACAQRYTDQPGLMDCCARLSDPEELNAFVELNPLTDKRKMTWENPRDVHNSEFGVWMHTFRAQFGQIDELKGALKKTEKSFLVRHGFNRVLCDGFDGTGQNLLGKCLMYLRGECGGTGEVSVSESYKAMIGDLREKTSLLVGSLTRDIWQNIMAHCSRAGVSTTDVVALSCVNKALSEWVPYCILALNQEFFDPIKRICGPKPMVTELPLSTGEQEPKSAGILEADKSVGKEKCVIS